MTTVINNDSEHEIQTPKRAIQLLGNGEKKKGDMVYQTKRNELLFR
jgi:hypothetical protein